MLSSDKDFQLSKAYSPLQQSWPHNGMCISLGLTSVEKQSVPHGRGACEEWLTNAGSPQNPGTALLSVPFLPPQESAALHVPCFHTGKGEGKLLVGPGRSLR